ncbi:hypothetical protein GCM10025859_50900 [Alicyclobacillus fastidiosus]|nr:hypothetical protein GCM10025859_50900 [Alicyclobacillus fastidiosus]
MLTLAAACTSALTMAFLYHPGTDPSRVYYGTDTRAFALLFGAALAVVWPSAKLSAEISIRSRVVLELAGVSALFLVIYTMYTTNEYEAFLYRGGLVLSSVVTAILVATLAHPASVLAKVVGCKPLRWLGVRSYGIYLWHYPVIVLTSPVVNTGGVDVVRDVLQVGASIALAALSWRYVEEPIRRGALAKLWTRKPSFKRRSAIRFGAAACALVVVTCAAVVEPHDLAATATPSTPVVADAKPVSSSPPANKPTVPKETTLPSQSDQPKQPPTPANTDSPSQSNRHTKEKTGVGVTTIGDSVMVDATPYLEKMLPGIVCDGEVGRQMSQAPAAIAALKAKGELGNRVIIELGTNGPFTKDELVSLLQSLGPVKQIILVNTRVPRPWEAVVNATLAQVARRSRTRHSSTGTPLAPGSSRISTPTGCTSILKAHRSMRRCW